MNEDLQEYKQYALDCISGKQVCCRYIKLAAKRYLSFFDNPEYEFRVDKVDKMVRFIQNITLFEDPFYGQKLKLLPFQKFLIYGGYGFYYKGTNERVVKHIILDIGRKQAKSTLCAAIALYHLIGENEYSAEVDIAANSKEQARILFRMSCELSKLMDKTGKHINRTINRVRYPKLSSFIQCLSAETSKLDGYGASLFIEDEFHAATDTKLYDVLASSQVARGNPMSIIATSAGYNLSGPYYSEIRKNAINMLEGLIENDSLFCLIYTLDEGDDFRDKKNWVKSMPGIGVTVEARKIEDRIKNIKTQPSTQVDVITKNFNVWVQSSETWILDDYILKSMKNLDLSMFSSVKDIYAVGGIDLSSVSDITCFSICWPYQEKLYFKTWCFLPEATIESSPNRELYRKAIQGGDLIATPGNVVDYEYILDKILEVNKDIKIFKIFYDQWNATQFVINATQKRLPMVPYSQSLGNFNRPTKEFERLMLSNKIVLDENVLVRWAFQNVEIMSDNNDNQKPKKSTKNGKIDPVISMLECLGGMLDSKPFQSFFKAL